MIYEHIVHILIEVANPISQPLLIHLREVLSILLVHLAIQVSLELVVVAAVLLLSLLLLIVVGHGVVWGLLISILLLLLLLRIQVSCLTLLAS